jgi:hypothetical protein
MRLKTAMVANYAEVRDSLLYISGGGAEWWRLAEMASVQRLAVVVSVELEDADLDITQHVLIGVRRPSDDGPGELLAAAEFTRSREEGESGGVVQNMAINLPVEFHEYGTHWFVIRATGWGEEPLAEVPLRVVPMED